MKRLLKVVVVLGFLVGLGCIGFAEEKEQGLVGYWRLDEGKGSIARDYSGNENHGTIKGDAKWVVEKGIEFTSFPALEFDGKSAYVDCGNGKSLNFDTGSFSYSCWVCVTESVGKWDMPIWKGGNNEPTPGYDMELGTDGWTACISDGTQIKMVNLRNETNKWVYLVVVVDRNQNKMFGYRDGSLVSSVDITGFGSVSSGQPLRIGGHPNYPFKGLIREVKLYNRALGEEEIKKHYEETRGIYPVVKEKIKGVSEKDMEVIETWKKEWWPYLLSASPLSNYVSVEASKYFCLPGEETKIKILVVGRGKASTLLKDNKVDIKVEVVDFFGKRIKDKEYAFVYKEPFEEELSVRLKEAGYYWINTTVSAGKEVLKKRRGVAVFSSPVETGMRDKNSSFGRHIYNPFPEGCRGVAWTRQYITWAGIEPEKGKYHWEGTDNLINQCYQLGLNILVDLYSAPQWAAMPPQEGWVKPTGALTGWHHFAPKDLDAWGRFVYEAVSRYKDKVKYWEIYNEPYNFNMFFIGGSAQLYADVLKVAYQKAKEADPDCKIVGISGYPWWAKQVFQCGGYPYLDIVSIHNYQFTEASPEEEKGYFLKGIKEIKEVMKEFGKEKPVWSTETGWPTHVGTQGTWPGVPEELQARYTPRAQIIALSEGIEKVFWFKQDDLSGAPQEFLYHFGFLYEDSSPKPAFVSYAVLSEMIKGLDYKEKLKISHPSVYGYCFEKGGISCFPLWSLEDMRLVVSSLPKGVKIYNMMGQVVEPKLKDGKYVISLSGDPIYLRAKGVETGKIKERLEKAEVIKVQ